MANRIGIRLEDKNVWERRVALTPDAVKRGFDRVIYGLTRVAGANGMGDDQVFLQIG